MVAKGLGVALVPMVEAHLPLPPGIRTLSLGEHTFYREIGLLQRKPRGNPSIIGQFAQCLREAAEVGQQKTRASKPKKTAPGGS
jgi:DNA-binding transcriptional LysR family regulator